MVRNFFFNRNRRTEAQQTVPPQSTARSIDHTEFGTLGQSLQQELKLVAQLNRLQIRCAIREGILLVLTEHLLHVEPDPQQTFVILEQTIREVTPKLLESDPTCSPTVHSRPLPVRLYLRVAGYQQPYAFHSFTLDPGDSTASELVDRVNDRPINTEVSKPEVPKLVAVEPEAAPIDAPEISVPEVSVPEVTTPEITTPEIDTSEIVNASHLAPIDQLVEAEPADLPAPVEPLVLTESPAPESPAPEPFTPELEAEAIDNRLEFAAESSIVEEPSASIQLPAYESESATETVIPEESAVDQLVEELTDVSPDQPQVDLIIDSTEVSEPVTDTRLNETEITEPSPIAEFAAEPLESVSFDDILVDSTQDASLISADALTEPSAESSDESFVEHEQTEIVDIDADTKTEIETTNFIEYVAKIEPGQGLEIEIEQEAFSETIAADRVQAYINPETISETNPQSDSQITDYGVTELQSQNFGFQSEDADTPSISIELEPIENFPIERDLSQDPSQDLTQDLYANATPILDTSLVSEQARGSITEVEPGSELEIKPEVEPEIEPESKLESESELEPELGSETELELGSEIEPEIIFSGDDLRDEEIELYTDLPHKALEELEDQKNNSIDYQTRIETTTFDDQARTFIDLEQTYSEQTHNGSDPTNSSQVGNAVTQFPHHSRDAITVSNRTANPSEETEKNQPIRLIPNVRESASSFDRLPLDVGDDMAQKAFRSRFTLSGVMLMGAVGLFFVVGGVYVFTRPCVLSRQCVPLQQAQQLTQRALIALQTNPSALEVVDAYDQLTQANQLLETIPFWSGSYRQAQTLTTEYSGQVEELSLVVQALNQANTAAKKSLSPPHPISVWREVQLTWREAINLLGQVPVSSSVYGLAQNKLVEYQSNLDSINTRIIVEQNALDRLEAVKKAADVTDARSKIVDSADSWQQTYTSWQTILDQLQQIPQGTMAYSEAQRLSRVYQLQLEAAEKRRSQEERSTNAYNQAIALADQARRLDQQGQISQAIDYWREAISTIKQVSEGTTSYNQAQSLLNSYLTSLNQSEQRVKQMTLVQTVEPQLNQICSGSYTLCAYTLTTEAIRVQLTAEYDQIVIQALRSVQRNGSFGVRADTAERVNQFLQSLSSISESAQVPVELYSAGGIKFGTYDLNQSGYVLP